VRNIHEEQAMPAVENFSHLYLVSHGLRHS